MRYYAPAIVVCLLGVALVLGAVIAMAAPPARGGQATAPGTSKAPHQPGLGLVRGGVVQRPTGCGGFYYGC